MNPIPFRDPARIWLVEVDFLSGEERFATEPFALRADTELAARVGALALADDSIYADPRVPDPARVVRSAEHADRMPHYRALTILLAQASDALGCCLDDLDAWVSAGPEGYAAEEQQRRDRYETILARIDAAL